LAQSELSQRHLKYTYMVKKREEMIPVKN